ncbi:hypothetical protein RB195_011872 [Necator americanus]|uniref:Uncharacterized protein n=1 Tax=Necator americanus TaxID=51031 RepID=A0ABR1D4E8_NECAM
MTIDWFWFLDVIAVTYAISKEDCKFEARIVNSTTKSKFPVEPTLCWSVTGSIRLGVLTGKLEIVNTAFQNLSFFGPLFKVMGEFVGGRLIPHE